MSTDPKRKELVVPINPANVPVFPSFHGVGPYTALEADHAKGHSDALDALIYAASAKPHPLQRQQLFGTASTSAPAAPHRAEGEPLCLTDPVVHGSVTLTDRRKVEVQVLYEVVTWFKRLGLVVTMDGNRVVGEYRDMVAEFCFMLAINNSTSIRARLDNGPVLETRTLYVTLNNSKISDATTGSIEDLRALARAPMTWDANADYRERARCHKRLTGLTLPVDTLQDREDAAWHNTDGFELDPQRWQVHVDFAKDAEPSERSIARIYGIKP